MCTGHFYYMHTYIILGDCIEAIVTERNPVPYIVSWKLIPKCSDFSTNGLPIEAREWTCSFKQSPSIW